MDYEKIFKNTISEFVRDLNILVSNEAVAKLQTTWDLFSDWLMTHILSTITAMTENEAGELFNNEDEKFFELPLEFFDQIELKHWYPGLDMQEKKIIWKYLKTLKFLSNKFILKK